MFTYTCTYIYIYCTYVHVRVLFYVSMMIRYFETFDAITDVDVNDRLKMMNLVRKCSNKEEVGKERMTIPLPWPTHTLSLTH